MNLFYCVASIALPLSGQIRSTDYFPALPDRPSGLIVNVVGGVVVEPVKMWYWSADPTIAKCDVLQYRFPFEVSEKGVIELTKRLAGDVPDQLPLPFEGKDG